MVDQANVRDRTNGRRAAEEESTLRRTGNAVQMAANLLHNVVCLAQLQLRLMAVDLKQVGARLTAPIAALGIGLLLAVGSIPVALIGIAFLLTDLAHLSRVAAVWITFGVAIVIGLALVGCSVWWFRRLPHVFDSSRDELAQNVERVKEMLRRASHPTRPESAPASPSTLCTFD